LPSALPTALPSLPPLLPPVLPPLVPTLPPIVSGPTGTPVRSEPSVPAVGPTTGPPPARRVRPGASGAPGGGSSTSGPSGALSPDLGRGHAARAEDARLLAEAPLPERLQVMGQNAVRNSGLPLGALLLLGLFLLLQDRFDRRDPKLALAPVYPEPHLTFGPPPEPSDHPTEIPR
jgi:hypothetical protein